MRYQWIFSLFVILMTCFSSSVQAKSIQDYVNDLPGIGLIADEINFEGITIKNLSFVENSHDHSSLIGKKYAITTPHQTLHVKADYSIEADLLENLAFHHFIYGLHNDGPQNCLMHTLGVFNSEGTAKFTIEAPEKPGVYQLRFCHVKGYGSFDSVKEEWWKGNGATSNTIMGIVVVTNE